MHKSDYTCLDPFLSRFVHSISILEFDAKPATEFLQLPPLGFPVLQFHFGKQANFYNQADLKDEALLIGQLTRHVVLRPEQGSALIGINFKPYGLKNLFGISPSVLTDSAIHAVDIFGREIIFKFLEQLRAEKASNEYRIILMHEFLLQVYPKFNQLKDNFYDEIVDHIVEKNGLLQIESLLSFRIKLRNLQRYFQHHIGISPKSFIKILRHKYVLGRMIENPQFHWNDPSLDGFYYDQSHFDRDFLKFSFQRPLQYINALDRNVKLFL